MLSAFGQLLTRLARERRVSKSQLARAAGCPPSVLTDGLKERGEDRKAYHPPLAFLDVWADALGLTGDERDEFILAGHLDRSTDLVRQRFAALRKQVKDLERPTGRRTTKGKR